jgi:hypothetical protein
MPSRVAVPLGPGEFVWHTYRTGTAFISIAVIGGRIAMSTVNLCGARTHLVGGHLARLCYAHIGETEPHYGFPAVSAQGDSVWGEACPDKTQSPTKPPPTGKSGFLPGTRGQRHHYRLRKKKHGAACTPSGLALTCTRVSGIWTAAYGVAAHRVPISGPGHRLTGTNTKSGQIWRVRAPCSQSAQVCPSGTIPYAFHLIYSGDTVSRRRERHADTGVTAGARAEYLKHCLAQHRENADVRRGPTARPRKGQTAHRYFGISHVRSTPRMKSQSPRNSIIPLLPTSQRSRHREVEACGNYMQPFAAVSVAIAIAVSTLNCFVHNFGWSRPVSVTREWQSAVPRRHLLHSGVIPRRIPSLPR